MVKPGTTILEVSCEKKVDAKMVLTDIKNIGRQPEEIPKKKM
jgi:hypothetical protein